MSWFNKPSPSEVGKQNDRALAKTGREVDRDRRQLERSEAQLKTDIKSAAKRNDTATVNVLAKQLVNLRKHKTRSHGMSAQISGIRAQGKTMTSSAKMAQAIGGTTKAMQAMNAQLNPQQMQATMDAFAKENMKMEMTDELITSTLDDILAGSDEEEEADTVVNQVLDELGIEMGAKISTAPKVPQTAAASGVSDADIEKMLTRLKAD